jgi:hypothetical protein
MELCFDTSGINRLYDDPERDLIVCALLAASQVIITGLNVTEAAASPTEGTNRRTGLLRLQRTLSRRFRPLHVPNRLLQVISIAYAEGRSTVPSTIGERQAGLWWALENPEGIPEEARQDAYAWMRALEDPFMKGHRQARPEFQKIFSGRRPLTTSKLIKLFGGQELLVHDMVSHLWKRLIGTDLSIESYRELIVRVPQWRLYLAGWVHAMQNRAIREQNYGAGNNPGAIDLLCAIYLPHCDCFVTDDVRQRRALRVLNVLNPRKTKILSYDELRRRLLLSTDSVNTRVDAVHGRVAHHLKRF